MTTLMLLMDLRSGQLLRLLEFFKNKTSSPISVVRGFFE